MARPEKFLNEGNLTLLGGIVGQLELEMPDFNTREEWEEWLDDLIEKHVVQVSKYSWSVVDNKEQYLADRAASPDEDDDGEDAYDYFYFDMSSL